MKTSQDKISKFNRKSVRILSLSFLVAASLAGPSAWADDLGYRYDEASNTCRSTSGNIGLNPAYWGECGDLRNLVAPESSSFQKRSFRGANLSGAVVENANLEGADFSGALLKNTRFRKSNLSGSRFYKNRFENVDFSSSLLAKAQIHSSGRSVSFKDADLNLALIHQRDIAGYTEKNLILLGADFSNANLEGAKISEVHMPGAVFRNARLRDAYLAAADISNSDFRGAVLDGAWIHGNVFGGLSGADLRNASLKNSRLASEISFSSADLRGADFTGANGHATWYYAKYDASTSLPFDQATADFYQMIFQTGN